MRFFLCILAFAFSVVFAQEEVLDVPSGFVESYQQQGHKLLSMEVVEKDDSTLAMRYSFQTCSNQQDSNQETSSNAGDIGPPIEASNCRISFEPRGWFCPLGWAHRQVIRCSGNTEEMCFKCRGSCWFSSCTLKANYRTCDNGNVSLTYTCGCAGRY